MSPAIYGRPRSSGLRDHGGRDLERLRLVDRLDLAERRDEVGRVEVALGARVELDEVLRRRSPRRQMHTRREAMGDGGR